MTLVEARKKITIWAKQFQREGESRDIAWLHAVQRVYEQGHITEGQADYFDVRNSLEVTSG